MEDKQRIHQLALALVTGVGTKLARQLIRHTGSVSGIFTEKPGILAKIPKISERIAGAIAEPEIIKRAEEEIAFMQQYGIEMVFFMDDSYPLHLRNCADAPIVLFYKGSLPIAMRKSISIIGTRRPTQRGLQLTRNWIAELSQAYPDLYIISGLAAGIDVTAHVSAMKNHLITLAVLGHGFHTLYPGSHRDIARNIIKDGCLLTDFFSNNRREPKNFIRRNRIIAGITDATLVVESAFKGGAMTTAEMANSYNREVFAVPGRPEDPYSVGCNYLIRSNQAILVSSADDIGFQMGWNSKSQTGSSKKNLDHVIKSHPPDQQKILKLLLEESYSFDGLLGKLEISPAQLSGILLSLEFEGHVRVLPGNRFMLADV